VTGFSPVGHLTFLQYILVAVAELKSNMQIASEGAMQQICIRAAITSRRTLKNNNIYIPEKTKPGILLSQVRASGCRWLGLRMV